MPNKKQKVAIGMSGGVDSSVAALLLKQQGFEVVGFFMKFWHDPTCDISRENACCNEKSLKDAEAVARMLDIPFYVLDARADFKKYVTDYFLNEYKNYQIPNPCVLCNQYIKFGFMLNRALGIDCDYVATGHYAKIEENNGKFALSKPKDLAKDQTYFLYRLSQDQLKKVLFPLGDLTKAEVREIAEKNGLPTASKKESQEICFIQDEKIQDFLLRYLPKEYFTPGDIIDSAGQKIGKHSGLLNYTIGQRRLVDQNVKNVSKEPLYTIALDKDANELIVGADEELFKDETQIENVRFIDENLAKENNIDDLTAKIRYRSPFAKCSITKNGEKYSVKFDEPQRAITPGQHVVFYKDDAVVGGGVIK